MTTATYNRAAMSTKPFTPVNGRVLQRKCACGEKGASGECAECKRKREVRGGMLQRSATSAKDAGEAPPIVYEVLRSAGRPLDDRVRMLMESRFGADFSGVRIHTDARAAESAAAVNANAYTVGQHVAFNEGLYSPASSRGRSLLAHELTHVVQQGGSWDGGTGLRIGASGDQFEHAADMAAASVGRPHPGGAAAGQFQAHEGSSPSSNVLQRQKATSTAAYEYSSEKWSQQSEDTFRRGGDTRAAAAIRACREHGDCGRILTQAEAREAYAYAKEQHGQAGAGSGPRLVRPQAASMGMGAAVMTGTALTWGATAGTAGAGAGASSIGATIVGALPAAAVVAIAGLFVLAIAEEVRISRFIRELEAVGFVVLANPLAVCIGACHGAPRARALPKDMPWQFAEPQPWPMPRPDWDDPVTRRQVERWLEAEKKPTPEPTPGPQRRPDPFAPPLPADPEERRNDCKRLFAFYRPMNCPAGGGDTDADRARRIGTSNPLDCEELKHRGSPIPPGEIEVCEFAAARWWHCTDRKTRDVWSLFQCACCDPEGELRWSWSPAHKK